MKKYLVAIGGIDPSALAGILADTRVFSRYQIPYQAVVTAITAQSEKKFLDWKKVDLHLFKKQLKAIEGKIFAVKIGMLATLGHAKLVTAWLKNKKPTWVLWDPVLESSTGAKLLRLSQTKTIPNALKDLLKKTDIFTPNIPEAEYFTSLAIHNRQEMIEAAEKIFSLEYSPSRVIILKGGHLDKNSKVADLVYDKKGALFLEAKRRKQGARGTGCQFGAAMLVGLYLGQDSRKAAKFAKDYVLDKVLL